MYLRIQIGWVGSPELLGWVRMDDMKSYDEIQKKKPRLEVAGREAGHFGATSFGGVKGSLVGHQVFTPASPTRSSPLGAYPSPAGRTPSQTWTGAQMRFTHHMD